MFKLKVIRKFQDKYTDVVYLPDSAFETEDLSRVNDLVKRGLCDLLDVVPVTPVAPVKADVVSFQGVDYPLDEMKEAMNAAGVKIAANAGVKGVSNAIKKLSDEEALKLSESLKKEE